MMTYIELCCGIGGTRAGLDAAGWDCVLAVDNDADAVAVHSIAHGEAVCRDVADLKVQSLPDADVWVAGFPCQPFSTSGHRSGFDHSAGNVFEHIFQLLRSKTPPLVIFENVEGLLTNKAGHTFSVILSSLSELGYRTSWLVLDLSWFGVPQTRPRLFIVGAIPGVLTESKVPCGGLQFPLETPNFAESVFFDIVGDMRLDCSLRSYGSLKSIEERVAPAIGKARYAGPKFFGSLGSAQGDEYVSYDIVLPRGERPVSSLAEVVAPRFSGPKNIRSGRYYARGGPTTLYLRGELISHCVGTSLGGAPLYAVPLDTIKDVNDRAAFLEFANWHREQDGMLVMRLRPDQAVRLFGPYTADLQEALRTWKAGETRKYKLVGNMVAPVCAKAIASIVDQHLVRNVPTGQREHARVIDGKPSAGKSEERIIAGGRARGRK